jgi:hypothetical protein
MEMVKLNVQTQIKFGLCKSNTNTVPGITRVDNQALSYTSGQTTDNWTGKVKVKLSTGRTLPSPCQYKCSVVYQLVQLKAWLSGLSNVPGAAAFKSEVARTH